MRIRHEQELRDSDRRKGEFLAVMSHELRNPVAAIQGALDVLHRSENRSSEQTQLYALMTRQVRQMVRIIDDLLDVVRISKGQLELQRGVVDLRVVAENAAETVRPILDKRHNTLVTEFARGLPSFHADGARLSQAVANLLVNASKYSAPRSTIRLSIVVEAQHIAISVEDEGIGLSADDTERIFEMFAQVGRTNDLSKDGLGVGLSLCRQIAFLHGGQVSATSAGLGAGSVFTISLPLSDTVVSAPETEIAAKTLIAERSGVRVLVADDNEDAAEALATLLRLSGYEVSVAHDGEQATRVAANEQPDIALLDLGMPKLTGYQVAQQIRAQSWAKRPLLIAITGWGQPEDLRNSAEAGFDKHFTKPVDFETLAQAIAEAM
jgi:CheY-like chemotaxis protein